MNSASYMTIARMFPEGTSAEKSYKRHNGKVAFELRIARIRGKESNEEETVASR